MIYPFRCPICDNYKEVIRPVSECSEHEICECGTTMDRVWTSFNINATSHETYFNHGLGKVVSSESDVKEEIKRINGENGSNIEQIGNEKVNTKKKKKNYNLSRSEMQDVNSMLGV